MRMTFKAVAIASMLAAGIVAAPALYAHGSQGSQDSMMGSGMMGQGGMMNMKRQMNEMMGNCNKMMSSMMREHGSKHPHDQQQKKEPARPNK